MNFDLFPASIDINMITGKARFFLGDRWVEIGNIEMEMDGRFLCQIKLPDIEDFLNKRDLLDDGSVDWFEWGVRLN